MVAFFYFLMFLLAILIPISVGIVYKPLDKYRRWKHPQWFEYYDRAKKETIDLGKFLRSTCAAVEEQHHIIISLYQNKILEQEQFLRLSRDLCYAFDIFHDEYNRRKKENELLIRKAHEYAVKNNLKWGLLCSDESN